jgi:hypothetical protein
MPLYWFHIDALAPPLVLADRLRSVVQKEPESQGFWSTWKPREPVGPPFIGTVQDCSFKLRRDIRRRNSFLPRVKGHIIPTPTGARVDVIMFLHPFTALFMLYWLGLVGYGAWSDTSSSAPILWGMFIFGIALTAGGFFPEAVKAKRLLSAALLNAEERPEK